MGTAGLTRIWSFLYKKSIVQGIFDEIRNNLRYIIGYSSLNATVPIRFDNPSFTLSCLGFPLEIVVWIYDRILDDN